MQFHFQEGVHHAQQIPRAARRLSSVELTNCGEYPDPKQTSKIKAWLAPALSYPLNADFCVKGLDRTGIRLSLQVQGIIN
jgi:hypothetical protein